MSATCRTCHAPVLWVVNERTGKRMPLDLEPETVMSGTRFVLAGERRGVPVARVATGIEGGRRSHFATCPDADSHRRAR